MRSRCRDPTSSRTSASLASTGRPIWPSRHDDDRIDVAATCEYCEPLNAAFRLGNVFATQFHPEKSGTAGLQLLANFVDVCAA